MNERQRIERDDELLSALARGEVPDSLPLTGMLAAYVADCGEREFDPSNPAQQRIWNDSAEGATVVPSDPRTHSPVAIAVLVAFGVDSYRAWIRQRRSARRRGR